MSDLENGTDLLIDYEQEVMTVRLIDNMFTPATLRIRSEVIAVDGKSPSVSDFDVAFAKIRFWFENILTRGIIFQRGNKDALTMLLDDEGRNRSGNLLMVCPDEPSDEHLAALFQAKMSALANGVVTFGTVQVRSDNTIGLVFTFVGDANDCLPGAKDWLTDHNYFSQPWWHRDDASALDVIPSAVTDVSQVPAWAYSLDFIEDAVRPRAKEAPVLRPQFVPTVIKGGKPEDTPEP